jgi:hypothetical protein
VGTRASPAREQQPNPVAGEVAPPSPLSSLVVGPAPAAQLREAAPLWPWRKAAHPAAPQEPGILLPPPLLVCEPHAPSPVERREGWAPALWAQGRRPRQPAARQLRAQHAPVPRAQRSTAASQALRPTSGRNARTPWRCRRLHLRSIDSISSCLSSSFPRSLGETDSAMRAGPLALSVHYGRQGIKPSPIT